MDSDCLFCVSLCELCASVVSVYKSNHGGTEFTQRNTEKTIT